MGQQAIITDYPDARVMSNIRNSKGIPVFKKNDTYTATRVTTWYDGSTMTPEKADGLIYMRHKSSGDYYLANLPNWGETFLEKDAIVRDSSTPSSESTVRELTSTEILLLKMKYYKGVKVNGYYKNGDTPGAIEYLLSTTSATDDGGSVIEVGDIKLERIFVGSTNIAYFGSKGDNIFDNSQAFNRASKALGVKGGTVWIDAGDYRVDNTVEVNNTLGVVFKGTCTQGVRIWVYSMEEDSTLFYFNAGSSYSGLEDVELLERDSATGLTRGKVTAIKYQDQLPMTIRPNWKGKIFGCRVVGFKEGLTITTANPLSGTTHAHLDSLTVMHSKFRNCRTTLRVQNIQAVNINFYNVDSENDDAGEQYTHIVNESGFSININGGSWIGRGKIYQDVFPVGGTNLFPANKVTFRGTKFEIRSGAVNDMFSVLKTTLRSTINIDDCKFLLFGQNLIFSEYAGKSVFNIKNTEVVSGTYTINVYPTQNLSGSSTSNGAEYFGDITIDGSLGFKVEKLTSSPYGTYNAQFTPKITIRNGGSQTGASITKDAQDFMSVLNPDFQQRGFGLANANSYKLIYNNDNVMSGFKSVKFILPKGATPMKMMVFKQPVRHSSAIEYKLYVVKDKADWADNVTFVFNPATDAILLCSSGSTASKSGYMEFPVNLTSGFYASTYYFQSGMGKWLEGRMYLEHSGSADFFGGFVGVEYM